MITLPTNNTWRHYGRKEPIFGVFGQEQYLSRNITGEDIQYFFSSGAEYVDQLFSFIRKKVDPAFDPKTILDFGCGPGRMLIPFARLAEEVFGVDVSGEMLAEAKRNCTEHGVSNVKFLISDDRLDCLGGLQFDLVHSFIVLQHLNTRRGEKLFGLLADTVSVGGIGVLHVTYFDNYTARRFLNFFRFRIPLLWAVQRTLTSLVQNKSLHFQPQMQMNSYNLNRVFYLLQKRGITDILSEFTNHHEYRGVTLYFKKTR